MGKGQPTRTRTRRVRTSAPRPPTPPQGDDGARLLARIRKALVAQRAGGPAFRPSREERRVLEWLAYESGADMEMDRNPRYARAFAVVQLQRPEVLKAIQDPASVVDGLNYPLDIGEVVALLRRAGLEVDEAGTAVRRFADSFDVPQLGASQRRTFFARHLLEIVSAVILEVTPKEIKDLGRHLVFALNEKEVVIAPMIPAVPTEQAVVLARSAPVVTVGRRGA